jgi:hypothetical protein
VLFVLIASGYGRPAGAIDVRELAPIAESFRQLAFWDATAAGDVWMTEEAATTWESFVSAALPNQAAAVSLFSHCIVVGDVSSDGTPFAGLFNPWVGALVVFAFSDAASAIEAVAIEIVADGLTETEDANQVALDIMAAIALASDRLDEYLTQPWQSVATETDWQIIANRLIARSAQLRLAYPAEDSPDPDLVLAQDTITGVQSGDLTNLLTVLEDADPLWVQSLLPVCASKTDDGVVLILSSSLEPLHLAWVNISGGAIQDVSWIRLFDRVITQTRGKS